MFDMLSGQYKNLASKGRYGDTMLAHINPEEAAMLQSMGGSGTINPQTGLREFWQDASGNTVGMPTPLPTTNEYMGGLNFKQTVIAPFDRSFADLQQGGMGVYKVTGYTLPSDQTFAGIPLVTKYDPQGGFNYLTLKPGEAITPDPSQPNIISVPRLDASGNVTDWGIVDTNNQDNGSFGSFIRGVASDFGPMILAGLGANFAAGNLGGLGAAGASSGTGLSLGGSGLGLTGTAGTGLNLAATTGGGLGLTAGSAGAGLIGAGLGTALGAINTGISSGAGIGTGTGVDYSLGGAAGGAGGGTGITTGGTGTGLTTGGTGTGITTGGLTTGGGTSLVDTLKTAGSGIIDTITKNPSLAGSVLGAATSLIGGANAPTSQTSTTSIDPQIKAEYLANLERAKTTAAGLEARLIAQPGQLYTDAESKLYNLGMTPFGAEDIAKFYNPYENQVVQGALGDIERTRQMQEQANRDQATRARAFGGSRQGVVTGMTNEAAMRQAANTAAQLRSAGYTQAANLGLQARPMDIAGLQTSLGLYTTRTALEQARLDALRNLGTERLGITSGALGMNIPNLGSSSSQPLYNNTAGNLLSGGLTGAYIGSLLQPNQPKVSLG